MEEIILSKCNLRPIQYNSFDIGFIKDIFSDPEVRKYYVLRDDHAQNLESFVLFMVQRERNNSGLEYIIENKYGESVGFITGEVRMNQILREVECDIGYAISPEHRNKGFASEALRGITDFILGNTNIQRVTLDISDENVGSIEVAKKCGFIKELSNRMAFIDPNHLELGPRSKWVKVASEDRRSVFQKAVNAFRVKDWPHTIFLFKKALEYDEIPGFSDALCYSNMDMAYSSNRQYQEAFRCLQKAQSLGLYNSSIDRELQWLKNHVGLY